MLELVLTRPRERGLVKAAKGLWFLVLDELHTYRGRQGADVALLVRRLRDSCDAPDVQCIGTSATMTTEGGAEDQRKEVAEGRGHPVRRPGRPGERDRRDAGADHRPGSRSRQQALRERVADPVPPSGLRRVHHGPAGHLDRGGLRVRAGLAGRTARAAAVAADHRPRRRRNWPGRPAPTKPPARVAIKETLQAGARIVNPSTGRPVFAFRLHQFLSKGDNVYVTLEPPARRHVTSTYQVAAPGSSPDAPDRILVPTAFCRECGQEYLAVTKIDDGRDHGYRPRRDNDASGGNDKSGYLFISDDQPWPRDAGAGADRRPAAVLLGDVRPGDRRPGHRPGQGAATSPSRSTWT